MHIFNKVPKEGWRLHCIRNLKDYMPQTEDLRPQTEVRSVPDLLISTLVQTSQWAPASSKRPFFIDTYKTPVVQTDIWQISFEYNHFKDADCTYSYSEWIAVLFESRQAVLTGPLHHHHVDGSP